MILEFVRGFGACSHYERILDLMAIWKLLHGKITRRNLIICNHPICDYMQLVIICNYGLLFLQLVTILFDLLFFLWPWCIILWLLYFYPSTLIKFWAFHPRKNLLYFKLVAKVVAIWLPLCDVPIPLNTLGCFLYIKGILITILNTYICHDLVLFLLCY